MSDFRNITELADPLSPTFQEYESCFEEEGFEDYGSWNPNSIDDIVSNCQQFQVDNTSSLSILRDTIASAGASDDRQAAQSVPASASASAPAFATASEVPTCYATLFPVIHMPTHFKTRFTLADIVRNIFKTLEEKEVSFRFIASETTWNCSYINEASHGSFVVRVYRYPANLGGIHHAIEMQRLDGDAWIFRAVYESLDEQLRDKSIEEVSPIWPRPSDWPQVEQQQEQFDEEEEAEKEGEQEEEQQQVEEEQFADTLKKVVVATLRHGRLSAVEESTQLCCSIYSQTVGAPKEVDIDCMKELMIIVDQSETNSDWASQHSVLALTSMSKNEKYCEAMMSFGETSDKFLKAIFALAKTGSFSTQQMRCKCVVLLHNLLETNENYIFSVLKEPKVCAWKESLFVQHILQNLQRY